MNRTVIIIIIALFVTVVFSFVAFTSLDRPTVYDYRLSRGRALLDAEDYLEVLRTLRDVPEAHSYLGAAYLRLHLYQAAIQEFEAAAKDKSQGSDPWVGLASTYIELGDASKAREQADHATGVEKESLDAWLALGRAYWLERNFAEAEKAALKAKELNPASPITTELLLHIYSDSDQSAKFESLLAGTSDPSKAIQNLAIQFYVHQAQFSRAYDLKTRFERSTIERSIFETELALRREPHRHDLYPQLTANLVIAGRFADAIEAARKYLGLAPLDLEVAKAYWMTGDKNSAVKFYSRASEAEVHKLSAEVALATITGDIAHWREAFRAQRVEQDYFILAGLEGVISAADPVRAAFAFRYAGIYDPSFYNQSARSAVKALEAEPENLDASLTLGTAYQRLNRIDDALRTLEAARERNPNNAEVWSRLANVKVQQSGVDPREIVRLMETAVKLEPANDGYLYTLGWVNDQMGNTAEATSLYERAIRLSSLSFEAMNNLALIYGNTGQPDRALRLLRQAVEADPASDTGYLNLANFYSRQRDWKNALLNLDRSLAINPSNATANVEKGRMHLEIGRVEEAIQELNHALEADPQFFEAYLLLSSAYERTGHLTEAVAAIEEARRIRPTAPEVAPALARLNAAREQVR
jgi:superkiller protein 3